MACNNMYLIHLICIFFSFLFDLSEIAGLPNGDDDDDGIEMKAIFQLNCRNAKIHERAPFPFWGETVWAARMFL